MDFLKGKKTYLVALVGIIINGLWGMGYLTAEWLPVANTILVFLGLGALRAGVNK